VAAAGFLLYAFQRAFLSPPSAGVSLDAIEHSRPMELLVAVLVLAVLLGTGFYSEPWMVLTDAPMQALGVHFEHTGMVSR